MLEKQVDLQTEALETILNELQKKGYCVLDNAFSIELIDALQQQINVLSPSDFHAAGIGRQKNFQLADSIRQDHIHWLNNQQEDAAKRFLDNMSQLQQAINRRLFLGLFDYEAHFAAYPTGGFYKKHLDAFKGKSNRVLSTVLYLNEDWSSADGGELILYDEHDLDLQIEKISPVKGRFLIFLSESFYHQVNPSNKERHSIAGWFRINNSLSGNIDPAS
ncbi:2OG-Fe(II) oxygenase [Marinomonas agarivorans]|nr:2OG-Fe(II) oxygenase [Marinomonas agarivorans]